MKLRLAAAILLAPLALTGCAAEHGMHQPQASQSVYTADEIMFAQMMIPHHEQAVSMSTMAETRTDNADLLHLTSHIKGAQSPEIIQMKSWLAASGTSLMHHGMAMDGMLTATEMATLKAATGKDFEKLYLTGMIKHHQGAIEMLDMIEDSTNPEVVTLRENIRETQTAEIKQMQDMLKNY